MSLPTKTTRPAVATARGADLLVSTYLQGQGQATPHSARQVASFSTFICSLHMMMPPDHSSIKAFTRLWPEQGVRTRYLVLISGHWHVLGRIYALDQQRRYSPTDPVRVARVLPSMVTQAARFLSLSINLKQDYGFPKSAVAAAPFLHYHHSIEHVWSHFSNMHMQDTHLGSPPLTPLKPGSHSAIKRIFFPFIVM